MLTVPGARCVEFVKGIHQGDMRLGTGKVPLQVGVRCLRTALKMRQ